MSRLTGVPAADYLYDGGSLESKQLRVLCLAVTESDVEAEDSRPDHPGITIAGALLSTASERNIP